jgi:signal transduction histidine kinase
MEDELRRAHDQLEVRVLERTRDLEAAVRVRDEFLSVASHELKTPITSLQLQVQMRRRLLEKQGPQAFTQERIEKMVQADEREVLRVAHLVDNMLDVTRLQSGKLQLDIEKVDLSAVVREVTERLERQILQADCKVSIDAPAPVIGDWDRYRVEQIYTNLLTNALKYGPRKPIRVSVTREGAFGRLVVRDQGIGIAKEHQGKIFDRFERAVQVGNTATGLGLGLYIVRQIVESHRGTVSVNSEVGLGSAFVVELPLEWSGT